MPCPKAVFGTPTNVLLGYTTSRVVVIRDRRLGLLRLLFQFLITLYIAVQVIYLNKYLKLESPQGTVRTSIMRPLANASDDEPWAKSALPDTRTLRYCAAYNGSQPAEHRLPCRFVGEVDIGEQFQDNVYIATRVKEAREVRRCESRVHCTHLFRASNSSEYFVAAVEDFTVLLDHAFHTPSIGIQASGRFMHGELEAPASSPLCADRPLNPDKRTCAIPPQRTFTGSIDVLSVRTLLQAAGVDLDTKSEDGTRSLRGDGAVLVLSVEYSNFDRWSGTREPTYKYTVRHLVGGTAKNAKVAYSRYPFDRVGQSSRGIRLVVLFTGELGAFRVEVLLVQITTSLTFIALATLIVDTVAMRFLPERREYRHAKFQVTHELSAIRDGKFGEDSIFEHDTPSLSGALLHSDPAPGAE